MHAQYNYRAPQHVGVDKQRQMTPTKQPSQAQFKHRKFVETGKQNTASFEEGGKVASFNNDFEMN